MEKAGSTNRILIVSLGSIKGVGFNQGKTDLTQTTDPTKQIVELIENKEERFIPQYEEVFKHVLERYHDDFRKEGLHSYDYKAKSGRVII